MSGQVADIVRLDQPPFEDAVADCMRESRPVILRGVVSDWPACRTWSPAYLRNAFGSTSVPVGIAQSQRFRVDPRVGELQVPRRRIPFGQYLDHVLSESLPGEPCYYLQRLPIPDFCPALEADLVLPSFVPRDQISSLNLWLGKNGSCTSLHWDSYANAMAQIQGAKHFVLFDPGQTCYLYPNSALSWAPHQSRLDLDAVDAAEFPLFARARPVECVLEAGEMLILPPCWWHEVHSIDLSISVNIWWKAECLSLFAPQIEIILRELSVAGRLMGVLAYLGNVRDVQDLRSGARRALECGAHWFAVMLSLAALQERLAHVGRIRHVLKRHEGSAVDFDVLNTRLKEQGCYDETLARRISSALSVGARIQSSDIRAVARHEAEHSLNETDVVLEHCIVPHTTRSGET